MSKLLLPSSVVLSVALMGLSSAQTSLQANASHNNAGGVNWGLSFDLTAGLNDVTVTALKAATRASAGGPVAFEVWRYDGSCLSGTGASPASGPTAGLSGWGYLGYASGVQGPSNGGVSNLLNIPDITVPAGETVGVTLIALFNGFNYFGSGSTSYQTFSDADLTLTTGDSRSQIFSPGGKLFVSRGLVGELMYTATSPSVGESFCGPAVPNTTGSPGVLTGSGSASVALNNLTLTASSLPDNVFGYFMVSDTQAFVPNFDGGPGNLCLGGDVGRFLGLGQVQLTGWAGEFSLDIDLGSLPRTTMEVAGVAGQTWSFQAWSRDYVSGGWTFNLTNGLEVLLVP